MKTKNCTIFAISACFFILAQKPVSSKDLEPKSCFDKQTLGPMFLIQQLINNNKDGGFPEKTLKEIEGLVNGLEDYLEDSASPETPLQAKIAQDTANEPWAELCRNGTVLECNCGPDCPYVPSTAWVSGRLTGQLLRIIGQMTKARRILEIGMFTGYGAVSLADSDLCEEIVCLEVEPYFVKFFKERMNGTKLVDKLRVILGSAINSLQILKDEGKQFDLIYCDADKINYLNYYTFIMDNDLLAKGGTIVVDDVLMMKNVFPKPTTANGRAIYDFNQFVKDDQRVNQIILPLEEGVMLITRKNE